MEYYLQVILTTVLPVLTALCGYLISYFNAKKEIQELKKSKEQRKQSSSDAKKTKKWNKSK